MASFVPPIKGVPSNLSGAPILQVIVDRASVDRVARGLDVALQAEAGRLALDLSQRAIRMLSELESGVGHAFLARKWTNTMPATAPDGSVTVQVWNEAENETFQTPSNAPNSTKTYPIAGKNLLDILLNGARPHTIRARDYRNPLQFPVVVGERQSRFAGIAMTPGGAVAAVFRNRNRPNAIAGSGLWSGAGDIVQQVNHPGVVGNRFLQFVKNRLESAIEAEVPALAGRVQARI